LGFVLLFQQFELLLLRNGNAFFQRCKDLKDKNVFVNQPRLRLIQKPPGTLHLRCHDTAFSN